MSSARHAVAVATRNNASLRAVAKQQRKRGDSGGGARFAAESHCLHMAGTIHLPVQYLTLSLVVLLFLSFIDGKQILKNNLVRSIFRWCIFVEYCAFVCF